MPGAARGATPSIAEEWGCTETGRGARRWSNTVQRTAAVTGVAAGARIAAGGTPGPGGANSPDLAAASPAVARIVAPVMGGTRINQVKPSQECRPPAAIPHGQIDVCTTVAGDMVTVRLRGRPAVGMPIPGLDWSLDLAAQVHAVTFEP
jgi:hypothetical protein